MARFQKGLTPWNARPDRHDIVRKRYPLEGIKLADSIGISKTALYVLSSRLGVKFVGERQPKSAATRQAISAKMSAVVKNAAWRARLSASLKGRPHSPERLQAIAAGVSRSRKTARTMTEPERRVDSILQFMCAGLGDMRYTGDRRLWLTMLDGKPKNPDFASPHLQKVIEVFGRYWHDGEDPDRLVARYREIGWECLVLWEDERIDRDRLYRFVYPYEYDAEQKEPFQCT